MMNLMTAEITEKIRAPAGIEPTTLWVLAHYSNHRATEALVVEQSLFDYKGNFWIFTAVICDHSNYFNEWRFHKGMQTGSLLGYWIPRDHKPINAEQIEGREHQSKCL